MNVTVWHNPRCSKSRATLAVLHEKGIAANIVEYKKTPPSIAEIRSALGLLGFAARGLIRQKDAAFKNLNVPEDASDDRLIALMSAHPEIIERPVVFANGKAAIGRPPESVLDIL